MDYQMIQTNLGKDEQNPPFLANNDVTEEAQLYLLQPSALRERYLLSPTDAGLIQQALQTLQQAFRDETPAHALLLVQTTLGQLAPIEMTPMPSGFATGTSLKSEQAAVVDGLMNFQHVMSPEPAKVVAASLLNAAQACLKLFAAFPTFDSLEAERLRRGFNCYGALLARVCGLVEAEAADFSATDRNTTAYISGDKAAKHLPPVSSTVDQTDEDYLWVWQQGHWVFMAMVQGLILCLRRLKWMADTGELAQARNEFETATQLMWASGAAMKLAGNFSKEVYQRDIRATMVMGDPKSRVEIEVSGIMFWDHHYLVNVIWKKEIAGLLRTLPPELHDAHSAFVEAYRAGLSAGHIEVCARFGGRETTSLLSSNAMAVDFLEKVELSRLRQIDPLQRMMVLSGESLVLGE
jgi:hypothetical protein